MNRSYRGLDRLMTVAERRQVAESLRFTMIKEKEDDLAMFMEMRRREMEVEREKERESLLVHNSDEFDAPLGSKPGTSPIFNIAASTPAPLHKTGPDDFLNSENDKNDYDWLLTPPDTPLFPSLDEAHTTYSNQHNTTKSRSMSLNSRLANTKIEIPKRNSQVPKQPASCPISSNRRPSSSGGTGSRPSTPTGWATLRSTSRPSTPNGYSTVTTTSRTSRPSTPISRGSLSLNKPTMPATSRSAGPTRSTTPLARTGGSPSTPISGASAPASRVSTPTRRPSPSPLTNNTSGPPSRSSSFLTRSVNSGSPLTKARTTPVKKTISPSVRSVSSAPPSSAHAPSPTMKPKPWKPSEIPGFSMDAPPNWRTSVNEGPLSASRGRPLSSGHSSSIEPGSVGRPKRQSCSPSRGRVSNGPVRPSGSSVPALRRTPKVSDNVNPILVGTRMVDRVVNMRKLPPPQDDKLSPNLSGKYASSPDSTGFGRTLSKKSLDMAIRHMDIRRSIPGNLRPLLANIPASSMYSVRSASGNAPTRGRSMSISDSPQTTTSSNASSEISISNNGLTLDMIDSDHDHGSIDRGMQTPSSICGREIYPTSHVIITTQKTTSFSGDSSALFDDDGDIGFDARLVSQRFDSVADDGVYGEESVMDPPLPICGTGGGIGLNSVGFKAQWNGEEDEVSGFGRSVLPVESEKGDALREWRRLNACRLAEKDKLEKEMRIVTFLEAEQYEAEFYKRRQVTVEKKKVSNRERQKIFVKNHDKFHKEAATNCWKAVADLVPKEVPAIEKRGKKDKDEKKPSITVIHGPKPGKPTDLARMRQIISKLQHRTPPHPMPAPSSLTSDAKPASPAVHVPPSQAMAAA